MTDAAQDLPVYKNPAPAVVVMTDADIAAIESIIRDRDAYRAIYGGSVRNRPDAQRIGVFGEYAYAKHFGFDPESLRTGNDLGYDFLHADGIRVNVMTVAEPKKNLAVNVQKVGSCHYHVLAEWIGGKTVTLVGQISDADLQAKGEYRLSETGTPILLLSRYALDDMPDKTRASRKRRKAGA